MSNRYIGSTEERINKWMRLCLHYQFDKKLGQAKKLSYYEKFPRKPTAFRRGMNWENYFF